jgi:hypothetical protein
LSGGALTTSGTSTFNNLTESAGTLTLAGTTTAAALTQNGGELNGSGTLTVTGAGSFAGGTQSGTGTTLVQGGASFNFNGLGIGLDGGRTLELGGTSTVAASGVTIDLNATNPNTGSSDPGTGTLTIMPGATFDDNSTSGFTIKATNQGGTDTGATAAVNNAGTFIKDGTSSQTTIAAPFNNTGTVEVDNGKLKTGEIVNGTLNLSGGGTDVGGTYKGSGTVNFSGGIHTLDSNSNIAGNATFSSGETTVNGGTGTGLFTVSGGTATFNGTVTTGSLTQNGGELNGSGTLTVTGAASFTTGTQSGLGTTNVEGGATFGTLSGYVFGLDGHRTLELGGRSIVTAGTTGIQIDLNAGSDQGTGTLTIMPGATFDDESTSAFTIKASSPDPANDPGTLAAVNNAGTFIKSGNSTTTISTLFNNTGTVDVQNGTLQFTGTVTNNGLLRADGGNIFLAGTVGAGSAEISGSSVLEFSAPSNVNITFDPGSTGTLKVDGSEGYGGTISGLALGNYVDLTNVQYTFGQNFAPIYEPNSTNTGGTLLVPIGVTGEVISYAALLNLSDPTGSYTANSFVETTDGHGGALITDPPVASPANLATLSSAPSGQSDPSSTAGALIAPITVADGKMVEINLPYTGQVSFDGPIGTGTLQLDRSADFRGTVAGMLGQDTLDLRDIQFSQVQKPIFSGDQTSGILSVTDGNQTANIQLLGNYIAAAFTTASDGHGGTFVETQPHPVVMLSTAHA